MRHLLTMVILTISISLPAREPCVFTATNLQCQDDGTDITDLSFNLTITDNNTIVTASSSVNFALSEKETNTTLLNANFNDASSTVAFDGYPISDDNTDVFYGFSTTGTCENIIGQTLNVTELNISGSSSPCEVLSTSGPYPMITFPGDSSPTPSVNLPNMGQWALIILGIGVVCMMLLVLVRGSKKESIF